LAIAIHPSKHCTICNSRYRQPGAQCAYCTTTTQADAGRVLDAIINTIGNALKNGDSVPLVGFGTFQITKKAARVGRNPATGAEIKIAAKNAPVFKAGKTLKDKVN